MEIRYYYHDGKVGFKTSGGCHLTKAHWEWAFLIDNSDYALVRDSEGYALLRIRKGKLLRLDCDDVDTYGNNLLRIRRNGKFGLVDYEGRTVIAPKYDTLTNYYAQFNIISRKGRYGLLNRLGEWVQPLRFDNIFPVIQHGNERLACFRRHKVLFL